MRCCRPCAQATENFRMHMSWWRWRIVFVTSRSGRSFHASTHAAQGARMHSFFCAHSRPIRLRTGGLRHHLETEREALREIEAIGKSVIEHGALIQAIEGPHNYAHTHTRNAHTHAHTHTHTQAGYRRTCRGGACRARPRAEPTRKTSQGKTSVLLGILTRPLFQNWRHLNCPSRPRRPANRKLSPMSPQRSSKVSRNRPLED